MAPGHEHGLAKGSPPPRVLIVDDDASVVETLARLLRLEGYDVLTALDGQAGLRQIDVAHPDAVLLDLRMPRMDAVAFLRQLRARDAHRHTAVAVITADYFVGDTIESELKALKADLYFKPLWSEDVIQITRRLIQRRRNNLQPRRGR